MAAPTAGHHLQLNEQLSLSETDCHFRDVLGHFLHVNWQQQHKYRKDIGANNSGVYLEHGSGVEFSIIPLVNTRRLQINDICFEISIQWISNVTLSDEAD